MGLLSNSARRELESNSNVEKVTASNVTYTSKFKISAIKQFQKGVSAKQIFLDAEINLNIFGENYPKYCLRRWLKIFNQLGEAGLKSRQQGKKSPGRPKKTFKSSDDELRYLRAENEFLKKLHALAEKYQK